MAITVSSRSVQYSSGVQKRSGTAAVYNRTKAAGVVVDTADSYKLKYNKNGSVVTLLDSSTTILSEVTKFCTTQFNAVTGTTGATLTNIVGLTAFSLAAAGVYAFQIHISGIATDNSGMKLGFGYTTLTATSLESSARGYVAAAVAVQHTTTATTGMTLFGQTASVLAVDIYGRLVVNAAGTLAVQAAQNAAHADTTSVYVGSWATFQRIS